MHHAAPRRVPRSASQLGLAIASLGATACTTVDPGPQFVVPDVHYNADYFFCHVEPELIVAKKCGDDGTGGCHYSGKVPGFALTTPPTIDCGGGDHPIDRTQIGSGSAAQGNLAAASLQMDPNYLNAPLYRWPTQLVGAHPVQVFPETDPVVDVIRTWATK